MNKLVLTTLLSSLLILPVVLQSARADDVTGQATIDATCGISFTGGASINFGTIARNANSAEITKQITNTGTVRSSLQVQGADWKDANTVTHLDKAKTKWAVDVNGASGASTAYASKTALTGTAATYGTIRADVTNSTYWELQASDMQNLPFTGAITQTITFTVTCTQT